MKDVPPPELDLAVLLRPKSVAVIGASERPNSVGRALFANVKNGFTGSLYPVNPKAASILGVRCYAAVEEIPAPVDLAVVIVPAAAVATVVAACGRKGVRGVVVISAGFKECGPEGRAREEALQALAHTHHLALLGPNCLGLFNTDPLVGLNATFAKRIPKPGNISFFSQSGALGVYALEFAAAHEIGMDRFVSLGNKAVLDETHALRAMAADPAVRVILGYLEDFRDPGAFFELADNITSGPEARPVLLLKAGDGRSGRRASASHTGALAERAEFLDDVCQQYGVLRMTSLEKMFDAAICLGRQPAPRGPRLCVVTNAGGPGILAADAAERCGLQLSEPAPALKAALAQALPSEAGLSNPIDVLGDADARRFGSALDILFASGEADAVLVLCTPQAMTDMEGMARALAERAPRAAARGVTLVAVFADFDPRSSVHRISESAGIPLYAFAENAVSALSAALRHTERRRTAKTNGIQPLAVDRDAAAEVFRQVRKEGRTTLGEPESQHVLQAYGFSLAAGKVVGDRTAVKSLAGGLTFPVAAKIYSHEILHKSEAKGVVIGVRDAQELEEAFDRLLANAASYRPEARVLGVWVQEMVSGGVETIIGASRHARFGPLLMFGLGGTQVEAVGDVRFRRAPLRSRDADEMIAGIRAAAVLNRFRNAPARDRGALRDALLRLSQLMIDFPEIEAVDINPLFALEQGAKVADARIVLAPPGR